MEGEGLVAGDGIHAFRAACRPVVGSFVLVEVRNVESGPLLLLFIPPDQLLALAPGPAVRPRRATVVENADIAGPRKSPTMSEIIFRLPLVGAVQVFLR